MAEKEFIEREAASRALCDACGNAACPKGLIPRCSYYEKMQSIPAADVRPVKPGKWLDDWETGCSECSVCHDSFLWEDFKGVADWNYCPNCGADMRPEPPKEET